MQAKLENFWKILSHFAYIKSGDRVPPPYELAKNAFFSSPAIFGRIFLSPFLGRRRIDRQGAGIANPGGFKTERCRTVMDQADRALTDRVQTDRVQTGRAQTDRVQRDRAQTDWG